MDCHGFKTMQSKNIIYSCIWRGGQRVTGHGIDPPRLQNHRAKYDRLAADLARNWGYKVIVVPVVVGDLGTVTHLRRHLNRTGLMNREQITRTIGDLQRETLCAGVQILKRHFTLDLE